MTPRSVFVMVASEVVRRPLIAGTGLLGALAILLGAGSGLLWWQDVAQRAADAARRDSVEAARDATVAMLSYRADTVEQDLMAARDHLTGGFIDSYTELVDKVVIPGAKEKKISAAARVAAATPITATPNHAVTLLFINQTVTMGSGVPSDTASSVRVTLDKVGRRWLVSGFDPV